MTTDAYEIGWLAGIFDGEGWVGVYRSGKSYGAYLGVSNTDREMITRIFRLVGNRGRIYDKMPKNYPDHWAPYYEWRCHKRDDILAILTVLQPHLTTKAVRAGLAIQLANLIGSRNCGPVQVNRVARNDIAVQIQALNKKGRRPDDLTRQDDDLRC